MWLKINAIIIVICCFSASMFNCWEMAATVDNEILLYHSNGTMVRKITVPDNKLFAIDYDSINNQFFIVTNDINIIKINNNIENNLINNSEIIFNQTIDERTEYKRIFGIVYEPVMNALFCTLKHDQKIIQIDLNTLPYTVNTLITFENEESPRGISVDSCQQLLFWTETKIKYQIVRSTLNGENRQAIVTENLGTPYGLTADSLTQRIFWTEYDSDHYHSKISSANYDGSSIINIVSSNDFEPLDLAIHKNNIFWLDNRLNEMWCISKNHSIAEKNDMQLIKSFPEIFKVGITTNRDYFKYENCKKQNQTLTTPSLIVSSTEITVTEISKCLNNGTLLSNNTCLCPIGFHGEQCELSICNNFCMNNGTCSVNELGSAQCICINGFIGERCEYCSYYCMNGGYCQLITLDNGIHPQCICPDGYVGKHCEHKNVDYLCDIICVHHSQFEYTEEFSTICKCSSDETWTSHDDDNNNSIENENLEKIEAELYSNVSLATRLQDPLVLVLLIATSLLTPATIILSTAVCWLRKRRPRIKRRIIVNKNITPLQQCRPPPIGPLSPPEHCEITIENCCNMNICDTPCYEPPQLRTSRTSKTEEKKTLLNNMENGNDIY